METGTRETNETGDENSFFGDAGNGNDERKNGTVTTQSDLERAVPDDKKKYYEEVDRYWINEPYAFVVIYHSTREDEHRYIVVEPHLGGPEREVLAVVRKKLRRSLDHESMESSARRGQDRAGHLRAQRETIRRETYELLRNLGLVPDERTTTWLGTLTGTVASAVAARRSTNIDPELAPLSETQERRLLYYLIRDFVDFGKIDPMIRDASLEDISCPKYGSKVFAFHKDYGRMPTNVTFDAEELDRFVTSLTERVDQGISRQQPQVDATLPDGSRAQLDYKTEVSPEGSNFTIRLFDAVPYTPVDLVDWGTFDIDLVTYLWTLIENGKSILFSGGTASGKTTTLNAFSMCIESNKKVVSIEDTREVELPHADWTPMVVREGFRDDASRIDEYQLLESTLRKRPNYIVMGEVRGEEGRTLLQAAATGHTVTTTFHAGNPAEVVDRFTSDPINAPEEMFESFDVITSQTKTRLGDRQVRRCARVVEIENDPLGAEPTGADSSVDLEPVWTWNRHCDEFERPSGPSPSHHLGDVARSNDWSGEELERELFKRKTLLAYLVDRNMKSYAEVAAALQAYMSAPEDVLALLARDQLEDKVDHLRTMENVEIDVDPRREQIVDRPDTGEDVAREVDRILDRARADLFPAYRDRHAELAESVNGRSLKAVSHGRDPDDAKQLVRQVVTNEPSAENGIEPESSPTGTGLGGTDK